MANKLKLPVASGYELTNDSYIKEDDFWRVEVGDEKQPGKFYSQVKFKKNWKEENEANMSVRFPQEFTADADKITINNNKIKWQNDDGKITADFYETEGGEYEFEIEFTEPEVVPSGGEISFTITTKNLQYLYQSKTVPSGHYRPENVKGSYAVYHASKRDDEYKTGKAFHIYRPWVEDKDGNGSWCDMTITSGTAHTGELKITIPQGFLAGAKYPIKLDPTFGNTDTGLSSDWMDGDELLGAAYSTPSHWESASIAKLTAYIASTSSTQFVKGALVKESNLNIITNGVTDSTTVFVAEGLHWEDISYSTNPTVDGNTSYVLMVVRDPAPGGTIYFVYDEDAGVTSYTDLSNSYASPTNPTDANSGNRKYSIYATTTGPITFERSAADGIVLGESILNDEIILTDGIKLGDTPVDTELMWRPGYSYRRKITIPASKIDANITDFPLPIYLTRCDLKFGDCRSDGHDIAFTSDAVGNQDLVFERVVFDNTNERAEFHVKVPSVTSGTDTEIYMWYGKATASGDNSNPNGVWDGNYECVYHYGNLTDSTSNGFDLTNNGATQKEFITGSGYYFVTNDYHEETSTACDGINTAITIETYFRWDDPGNYARIVAKQYTSSNTTVNSCFQLGFMSNDEFRWSIGSVFDVSPGVKPTDRETYYFAGYYDSAAEDAGFFVDETKEWTSSAYSSAIRTSTRNLTIATTKAAATPEYFFHGDIKEVRISKVRRSDAYLKATSYALHRNLFTWGDIETETTPATTWGLTDWSYRIKITADKTKIDQQLFHFPGFVDLTAATGFDFSDANASGADIRFTLADGVTQVPFERLVHDDATATGVYWIKCNDLYADSDTEFYMYYGNATGTDAASGTSVYDAGFLGVWHGTWNDSNQLVDSTSHGHHATKTNNNISESTFALMHKSTRQTANDSYFEKGSEADLLAPNKELTMTQLNYHESTSHNIYGAIWSYKSNVHMRTTPDYRNPVYYDDGTAESIYASYAWTKDAWYYKSHRISYYNRNRNTRLNYDTFSHDDGNEQKILEDDTGGYVRIPYNGASWLEGYIEEVRVSKWYRCDSWLKAEYEMYHQNIFSYGGKESQPAGQTYTITGTDGVKFGDTPVAGLTYTDSLTDGVELGDTPLAGLTYTDLMSDGVEFGDTPTAGLTYANVLSDGIEFADTILTQLTATDSLTDGIVMGDTPAVITIHNPQVSDGLKFGDTLDSILNIIASLSDGIELGDNVSAQMTAGETVTDGMTLGDVISSATLIVTETTSDGLKFSDVNSAQVQKNAFATDGIVLGDTPAGFITYIIEVADGIIMSDVVDTLLQTTAVLTDGFKLGDTIISYYFGEPVIWFVSDDKTFRFVVKKKTQRFTSKDKTFRLDAFDHWKKKT